MTKSIYPESGQRISLTAFLLKQGVFNPTPDDQKRRLLELARKAGYKFSEDQFEAEFRKAVTKDFIRKQKSVISTPVDPAEDSTIFTSVQENLTKLRDGLLQANRANADLANTIDNIVFGNMAQIHALVTENRHWRKLAQEYKEELDRLKTHPGRKHR